MFREIVYLTKLIPHTKFWALNKIKYLLQEPILDLGCHIGDTFWYMKIHGDITGIDIFEKYFPKCSSRKIYKELIQMDLRNISEDFGKYATVSSFFVLEHIPKREGIELLRKMECLGRTVVILVPFGKSPQEAQDSNEYQKHVSEWYPEDFIQRGFEVSICIQLSIKKITKFPYKLILATKQQCGESI